MKTIAYFKYLVPFLILCALTGCQDDSLFSTLDGEEHQISDYRGDWLVVNFWAEWCAPCREEVPELNALAGGNAVPLKVLGISYDPIPNEQVSEIATFWGIQYDLVATDPIPVLPFSLPDKLPTTYLLSPKGEVIQIFEGKLTAENVYRAIRQNNHSGDAVSAVK